MTDVNTNRGQDGHLQTPNVNANPPSPNIDGGDVKPDRPTDTTDAEIARIVDEYVGVLKHTISTKEQQEEATAAIRRLVVEARLDEISDIETRGNYSGYVDVYKGKLGITTIERIKALQAQKESNT